MTEQSSSPIDDETSGHRLFSDRNVKEDVQPVDHDHDDDTSGHRLYSDRNVKEDVQPVDHDET